MIRLDGVCCERGGRAVLDEVALAVCAADMVVVTGGRGAGKSMLLSIVAARRAPDRGAVWIASRNMVGLQRSSLPFVHRNVAYLPAVPPLDDDETVRQNVVLALAVRGDAVAAAEEEASRVLAALALEACAERAVRTLSAGERGLVALARALVGTPAVIVLDEPAAGLDADDRSRVVGAIAGAKDDGAAIVCGTADLALAEALAARGARRVRLEGGRLAGDAPMIGLVATRHEDSRAGAVRVKVLGGSRGESR